MLPDLSDFVIVGYVDASRYTRAGKGEHVKTGEKLKLIKLHCIQEHLVKSGLKNSSFSNSLGQGNIGNISSALSTKT